MLYEAIQAKDTPEESNYTKEDERTQHRAIQRILEGIEEDTPGTPGSIPKDKREEILPAALDSHER